MRAILNQKRAQWRGPEHAALTFGKKPRLWRVFRYRCEGYIGSDIEEERPPVSDRRMLRCWVRRAPSPLFAQVFILKRLKVVCFHTLLQVLILNLLTRRKRSCG